MVFQDRSDAGRRLAFKLLPYANKKAHVLAIPRGGVVVGAELARTLNIPLDVVIPRKLRAPDNPELAIGAVAHDGSIYLDPHLPPGMAGDAYLREEIRAQQDEIARRTTAYRGGQDYSAVAGTIAILVDDGIATGSTMMAAVRAVRKMEPRRVVVAIPVAPLEGVQRLQQEADEVVVLYAPPVFYAVGQFYEDFTQTSDEEVQALLVRYGRSESALVSKDAVPPKAGETPPGGSLPGSSSPPAS